MQKITSKDNSLIKHIKKLKEKNHQLENYISKTFEVVRYLFNFPIERFKRLVDNFMKNR